MLLRKDNAGIMNTPCHITSDDFESQFQTVSSYPPLFFL